MRRARPAALPQGRGPCQRPARPSRGTGTAGAARTRRGVPRALASGRRERKLQRRVHKLHHDRRVRAATVRPPPRAARTASRGWYRGYRDPLAPAAIPRPIVLRVRPRTGVLRPDPRPQRIARVAGPAGGARLRLRAGPWGQRLGEVPPRRDHRITTTMSALCGGGMLCGSWKWCAATSGSRSHRTASTRK